ncbi:MAG: hypothetical protein IKX74_05095 [Erysipelotrichaceae bacterium]|nr:hypothetical protein [Erysipelotrichaceae bacterium]MBO4537619.1 hypothetical protein [Erysipelotrichaceae bacterium]MBR5048996.1 hypothetical protein [Erysipelotrichaceae bacterium]
MRKLLISFICILLTLGGCKSKEFEPVVSLKQDILELNQEIDPLALIQDTQNAGLLFEVVSSDLNTAVPGTYSITYRISKDRNSAEKTFEVTVKDNDPPVIECPDSIELLYGNPFVFSQHAKATDPQDGDVTELMRYEGVINTYKEGSYPITIIARDRFDNTASKEVTVTVKKDKDESYRASICGTYRDSSYTSGQAPTLTLSSDGTFLLYISNCSLLNLVEGTYMQYEDVLYLTSEDYEFSYTPEENLVRFIVQVDGTLMFDSHLNLCAPSYGDIFEK